MIPTFIYLLSVIAFLFFFFPSAMGWGPAASIGLRCRVHSEFSFYSFFFFPFIFYFFILVLFIYLLYNIVLILPYIDMNPSWVYLCSPSWTLLPPPSPSQPSGSSRCSSSEHPVACIKLRLVIRFTCDNYMLQCHSPISSRPRSLQHFRIFSHLIFFRLTVV